MTEERLSEPFIGFDSIDERMKRIPNDLNNPQVREEYIRNHIEWFLKNHPDAIEPFLETVQKKYGTKPLKSVQISFFDNPINGFMSENS